MAIEIIDGFKVNSAVPVDNRIVASGSTARNAIAYKYNGLRVYDTYDGIPYVWNNNTWNKESESSLSVPSNITLGYGSTSTYKVGQILKVLDNNKQLTNSNMFELNWLNASGAITNRVIAINHIDGSGNNTTNTVSNTAKLDVKGSIKATSFEGSGANITDISPLNFNTSTSKIKINQIEPGTNGYVLSTGLDPGNPSSSILQWINLNQAIAPSSITTSIETGSSNPHYLTFVPSNGAAPLYTNFSSVTNLIGVIPSTNQIVVKNLNNPVSPPYSFINEQNTGIYRSAAGSLAISILGTKKIEVDTNGLKINAGSAANPGLTFIGANNYGIYQKTVTNHNRIGVVVNSAEVMRIKSTGGPGNGNTTLFGNGGVLSLVGNTHAYIEFYRQGSATPDATSVATPVASGRGAYIGFPSGSSQDFYLTNETPNTFYSLKNDGRVEIASRVNVAYGITMGNKGGSTVDSGYGVYMYGTFTSAQLQTPHAGVIARFDANVGSSSYTTAYMTTQGLVLWGHPTGSGGQPSFSGSAAVPSLTFNGNGGTGLYSDAANTLGITTGGVSRFILNQTVLHISSTITTSLFGGVQIGSNSTIIRRVIAGTIVAYRDGSQCSISYGSGFAATMMTSGNSARARVTFNTPFTGSNLSIIISPINTSSSMTVYVHSWDSGRFDIGTAGFGAGTITISFIVMQV